MFAEELDEIPLEDISMVYDAADEAARKAVSMVLEGQNAQWLVSMINPDRHVDQQYAGFGIYKAEHDMIAPLVFNALAPLDDDDTTGRAIWGIVFWAQSHGLLEDLKSALEIQQNDS